MNVPEKIEFFKKHLVDNYNISEDIINQCFIPEETTDDIEIKGSIIQALTLANFDPSFQVCVNEAYKVYKHVYDGYIFDYEITDFTKNNKDRFIESDQND